MTKVFYTIILFGCLTLHPVTAQTEDNRQAVRKSIERSNTILDRFSRKSERRTKIAERRFARYEKKMNSVEGFAVQKVQDNSSRDDESSNGTAPNDVHQKSILNPIQDKNQKSEGSGKEPLLDSLRLIHDFVEYSGISLGEANRKSSTFSSTQSIENRKSISRAQNQLNTTQRTKNDLLARKEYWKTQIGEANLQLDAVNQKSKIKNQKCLSRMEKERYYYTA